MSRKRDEYLDVDLADAICGDLPDGAYWAMMEEMTGMEPADMVGGFGHSKNSRKKLRASPHKTTPKFRKQLVAFGHLRQCSEHHWQLRADFGVLNWWPHKGKWNFDSSPAEVGDFKEMLVEIETRAAEHKATALPHSGKDDGERE